MASQNNNFLDKGRAYVDAGLREQDNKEAIELLEKGITAFEIHLKYEQNPVSKEIIQKRVKEYKGLVERLKDAIKLKEERELNKKAKKVAKQKTNKKMSFGPDLSTFLHNVCGGFTTFGFALTVCFLAVGIGGFVIVTTFHDVEILTSFAWVASFFCSIIGVIMGFISCASCWMRYPEEMSVC